MGPLISICIPVYEMRGKGVEYLTHSLNILHSQTYKNFEVVVSDNSVDGTLRALCESYSGKLNIYHYYNPSELKTMGSNINNAISNARGDVIKILFQDDFLVDSSSLECQLVHFLGNANHWMVTACCHSKDDMVFYNPFYPKYHENIQYGENTISSPSVVMFRNENVIPFDDNLFWLIDVDFYHQMYSRFGLPSICNYITVVNREHENRVSHNDATEERRRLELNYVIEKYIDEKENI
jgi:glycosyltransferase involved in cell wall biosynthesis